ncbi:PREDICTED: uncharacterized protein LOC109116084 [Tarenaya hassleriana]|uniref:uncharacterized protein LOC109116084 n=1 Tax=Tarenaya hassleriana TaxID=28532 RepID=UPI0008FCE276|nr:PREDICTED: uncharacterized protein LOC109116084 [Tarenaya hassleriana]
MFNSVDEVKDAFFKYVLKYKFEVKINRMEQKKISAICDHPDCSWRIYASVDVTKDKWIIKTYNNDHNHIPKRESKMLKMRTIANMFLDQLRSDPTYPAKEMQYEIKRCFNIEVSKGICYKARSVGLRIVMEDQKVQFAKLWDYEAEIRRSNPNTTTEIGTVSGIQGRQLFHRFYVCFEALRETFKKYCRPVIGLDGCFLKWSLKDQLLAAIGRDGNNRMYPIAWAVVRVEDNDTWSWFVRKLKQDLCLGDGRTLTIISDKQKERTRFCMSTPSGYGRYEVMDFGTLHSLDLASKSRGEHVERLRENQVRLHQSGRHHLLNLDAVKARAPRYQVRQVKPRNLHFLSRGTDVMNSE